LKKYWLSLATMIFLSSCASIDLSSSYVMLPPPSAADEVYKVENGSFRDKIKIRKVFFGLHQNPTGEELKGALERILNSEIKNRGGDCVENLRISYWDSGDLWWSFGGTVAGFLVGEGANLLFPTSNTPSTIGNLVIGGGGGYVVSNIFARTMIVVTGDVCKHKAAP